MNDQSFSHVLAASSQPANSSFTTDDFPALSSKNPSQNRRDILLSSLIGNNTASKAIISDSRSNDSSVVGLRVDVQQLPIIHGKDSLSEPADKFTLKGLIDILQDKNEDVSLLSLGRDLSSLNLDLGKSDELYDVLMCPFADLPSEGAEPSFKLPSAYSTIQPLPNSLSKFSTFSDETLFYIFYTMPRSSLQEAAAQELYSRAWRYHKEFQLWLCADTSPGVAAPLKLDGAEKGIFVFFDPQSWGCVKKEWLIYKDQLELRLGKNLTFDNKH